MTVSELNELMSRYPEDERLPIFITALKDILRKPYIKALSDTDLISLINIFFYYEPQNKHPNLRQIMSSILADKVQQTSCEEQLIALEYIATQAPVYLILNIPALRANKFDVDALNKLANSDPEILLEDIDYSHDTTEMLMECSTLDECIGVLMPTSMPRPITSISTNPNTVFQAYDFESAPSCGSGLNCTIF